MALEKKLIVSIFFAAIVADVLSLPVASPHHYYKEKVSVRTKYKGYYPGKAVIVEEPVVSYGGGHGYAGGYEQVHGGYGQLQGGYGHLGGGYGHLGGSVASASAVAVVGGGAASASASSASSYGYGR